MNERGDNAPDPKHKRRRVATKIVAAIVCISFWWLVILAWNVYATETANFAKAVAVFSAIALACAITIQNHLRTLAFTAWVLTCVMTAFCFPRVFIAWGDFELKTLIVPLIQLIMFGMGATLAINTLKDPLAALAPAIFAPWMNISGSMLASWWATRPPKTNAALHPTRESS